MPKHEMIDRLSFLSTGGSLNDEPSAYSGVKTPILEGGDDHHRFEGGALREGGAPELMSKETLGLLAQYAAVGLLYGALPGTIYPLFTNYLNASGNTVVAARVLVNMPWSFKVFYGFLTDCFPIYGYRRRPYMVLGWTICVVMMVIMATTSLGDPYYPDPALRKIKPDELTPEQESTLNKTAEDSGGKYIVLMMFASVGYLMADVAADAVVVEYAQREPEAVRGRTQTAIYTVRTVSMAVANLIMAFLFNGKDYGGDYSFTLSFPQLMTCLAIVTIPIIPITWFTIKEEYFEPPRFSHYLNELWGVIQTRAVYQIIAYKFFGGIFENFSFVASDLVQTNWAHVTPRNEKLSVILTLIVTAVGIMITGRYGLHWNWRVITAATMITMVVLDAICSFFVTWDIVRNQYFWLGIPVIEQFPYSIGFIVSTYVVVELAEMGNEGAVYGLLTTVNNLSDPFAKTIMKNVNAPFDLTVENIQNDTTDVRKNVSATLIIMYVMKLLSLAWLPLLPRQKKETQMLKAHGGKSRTLGLFTVMYVAFAMVWSVSTNLMTIFPATKCLVIVGGSGCEDKDKTTNSTSTST